ncbi:hypothetical protein N7474_004480 [Penicillium riverlandense]|uniref:uncharacterized protein n=1 Tax=Penicillium riverlandense TaxID=1903569 RepID=UPI002547C41E|nr:uncharacterized protein N7474_004480 [Penicillium riverlandense]KAJ5818889.1 hypothetical protein N7474_004480 [Penicillium riverlandense]
MPAVNSAGMNHILHACKPEDPTAKDLIKQNVDRLVTMGFLTDQRKLTHDEKGMAMAETLAFDAETFESMIPDLNKVESARDQKLLQFARMRRAHERLQEAMDRIPDIANQDYPPERAPFELAPMGSGRGRGQVFPGTVLAGPVEPPKAPQSRAETGARARTEAKMNAKIEKAKKGV